MLDFKIQHLSKAKSELVIRNLGSIAGSLRDKGGVIGAALGFLVPKRLYSWISDLRLDFVIVYYKGALVFKIQNFCLKSTIEVFVYSYKNLALLRLVHRASISIKENVSSMYGISGR